MKQKTVWCVIYGNYFPREIDSIWATREDALARAEELNNDDFAWEVVEWEVQSRNLTPHAADGASMPANDSVSCQCGLCASENSTLEPPRR